MQRRTLTRRFCLTFLLSLMICMLAQAQAFAACPRGTSYVSAGDGCQNAQASGSVRRANYFTGFVEGKTYPARPPWNVAAVDYAIGYAGTLKDPAVSGNLPACVSGSGNMLTADADIQPCVIDHLDFSLHGGICFNVTGTKGQTVTFSNDKFASGGCTLYHGFIETQSGSKANVVAKYNEFDDKYSCKCGGDFTVLGINNLTLQYNAFINVTGRVINTGNGSGGAINSSYNYVEGIGNGWEHGEIVEINTGNPVVYNEQWNNYYATNTNCCDTALLYIDSGPPNYSGPGVITSSNASYNVLIARPNPHQRNSVSVAAPIWIQTAGGGGVTFGALTVNNNYIDASGSYWRITVYPPDGTGAIHNGACAGNKSLTTGAAITGTLGSGTSTLVCQ